MALFPAAPTNGQTTTVNGILYTYNSAQSAWIRTSAGISSDITIAGNGIFTGNVTASYFLGNGSQLTGLVIPSGASISNGTSNVNISSAGSNITASVGGTPNVIVITTTGANIAGTVSTSGNAIVGNLSTAGLLSAAGNITGANLVTGGVLSVTGNSNVGNLGTAGVFATTLSSTGNANVGNLGTAGLITATGNITGANLVTGGVLSVTGNANIGNIGTAGLITATGNIQGGNLVTGGVVSATGNANVGNLGTTTAIITTGNITTINSGLLQNGTSNVAITNGANITLYVAGNANARWTATSTGMLANGTYSITGNANIGNIGTAGLITATGNITTDVNLITNNILGRTGALTITSAGTNTNINLKPNGTGNIDANSTYITNLKDPTNAQDAATKNYVDTALQGLHVHDSCLAGTTGTLAIASGGTTSYNNGTLGVGATIITTGTYLLIDGVNVQTVGTRILVKNEANAAWNGIYTYTNTTTLTRSTDFDTSAEANGGDFVFVTTGSTLADTGWVQTTDTPVIGTSNIVWTQFSGAGTYTAGTGLTLTGTQFNITDTTVAPATYGNASFVGQFTVNQQGQLTGASNVAITAPAGALTGATLNSTVISSNLTAVGTLTSLSVSGNANIGNIGTAGLITATGNITGGNIIGTLHVGNLSGTGNSNVGNLGAAGVFATTLSSTGNSNVGNLGTAGLITATGNIQGGNLTTGGVVSATGNIIVGGNLTSGTTNANLNINSNGTGNLVVSSTTPVVIANSATTTVAALSLTGAPSASAGNVGLLRLGNALSYTDVNLLGTLVGNANSYMQMILQNQSPNNTASADYVVSNDVNTNTLYGDFGINSSNFAAGGPFGDANGVYVYSAGGNLAVGTANAFATKFATNGVTRFELSSTGAANFSGPALTYAATAAPTADMVTVTNAGQPVVTSGVSGLQVNYVGGAAAVEASAIRVDVTPGGTTGGIWNGYRIAPGGAAASGVTMNGLKFDNKTAGAGTSTAIYCGTGWDNIISYNGSVIISGTGAITGTTITSNVTTGTAPFTVTSTTKVANLNVEQVDGFDASQTVVANTIAVRDVNGNISANYYIGNGSQLTGVVAAATSIANGTSNITIPVASGNINFSVGGTANAVVYTASNVVIGTGSTGNITGANVISGTTIQGFIQPTAGTTDTPPVLLTSGSLLATPVVGAIEYDASAFYTTENTTSGRGEIPSIYEYRYTTAGSALGAAIADYFPTTSSINLEANSYYEIDCMAYFLKTTAGTVTWTWLNSSAPGMLRSYYVGTVVTGFTTTTVTGTPITGYAVARAVAAVPHAATGSLTTAVYHHYHFKVHVVTNLATNLRLRVTNSAGTVTPQAGSYYAVRKISTNAGNFAT